MKVTTTAIPEAFRTMFRDLAIALQPRTPMTPAMVAVYFEALRDLPIEALERAAAALRQTATFFPSTGEWYQLANDLWDRPRVTPESGTRSLEELDELAPNDPERDEIGKRLSPDDQRRLMARYGLAWAAPEGGLT
jgi:hypothetical protein